MRSGVRLLALFAQATLGQELLIDAFCLLIGL
jgi:hypothetical protein